VRACRIGNQSWEKEASSPRAFGPHLSVALQLQSLRWLAAWLVEIGLESIITRNGDVLLQRCHLLCQQRSPSFSLEMRGPVASVVSIV